MNERSIKIGGWARCSSFLIRESKTSYVVHTWQSHTNGTFYSDTVSWLSFGDICPDFAGHARDPCIRMLVTYPSFLHEHSRSWSISANSITYASIFLLLLCEDWPRWRSASMPEAMIRVSLLYVYLHCKHFFIFLHPWRFILVILSSPNSYQLIARQKHSIKRWQAKHGLIDVRQSW